MLLAEAVFYKFLANGLRHPQNDLPKLGGSWATCFLGGVAVEISAARPSRRMRYFLLMCLGVSSWLQALGQTQLSVESPDVNSENLLVLLAPLVFIYGVSFFLHFFGADEAAAASIALRRHRALVGVMPADDFCAVCRRKPPGGVIRRIIRRKSRKPPAG
jgi:hypothetical protein